MTPTLVLLDKANKTLRLPLPWSAKTKRAALVCVSSLYLLALNWRCSSLSIRVLLEYDKHSMEGHESVPPLATPAQLLSSFDPPQAPGCSGISDSDSHWGWGSAADTLHAVAGVGFAVSSEYRAVSGERSQRETPT